MRTASTLIGLTLVALTAPARAQEGVPAGAAPPAQPPGETVAAPVAMGPAPAPSPKPIAIGLSFLPMAAGKLTSPVGAMETTGDASFAYGVGLSASFSMWGLSVGFAPQVIFNVQDKVNPSQLAAPGAATEVDVMARIAYTFPIVETIGLYVEALPGVSLIFQPNADKAKGLVLALGGGVTMDLTERTFANMGVGYQIGFQTVSNGVMNEDDRTKYVRVILGGGVKF